MKFFIHSGASSGFKENVKQIPGHDGLTKNFCYFLWYDIKAPIISSVKEV